MLASTVTAAPSLGELRRGWVAAAGEWGCGDQPVDPGGAVHDRLSGRRRGWAAVRLKNGEGGRAVVEQSPVQLPRRMPVGQRGGGEGGQPGGNVVAGGRGAGEGGGQGPPVRTEQKTRVDPVGEGLPRRASGLVVEA